MKAKTKKPARATRRAPEALPFRILAHRLTHARFDALQAAAKKLGISQTALVVEGLKLALEAHGEAKAAKAFEQPKEEA